MSRGLGDVYKRQNKGNRQIVWQSKECRGVLHAKWNPTWLDFPLIAFHVQQENVSDNQDQPYKKLRPADGEHPNYYEHRPPLY